MTKKTVFILVGLIAVTTCSRNWENPIDEKGAISREGLVAYYPFNSNAIDESGNENHGTVNGPVLTTGRFGNNNSAYKFDGIDDIIIIGDNESLRPGAITLAVWVNPSSLSDWATIIMKASLDKWDDGFGLAHYQGGSNDINFFINHHINSKVSGMVNLNTWSFIVATFDNSILSLYFDGQLVNSIAHSESITHSNSALQIGKGAGNPGVYYWKGIIDDVRIYNRALTVEEIQALYHENGWAN